MDFIFFDLDGTLLNQSSELSGFTRDTLLLLDKNGIAYTVATGRTLASATQVLGNHPLTQSQIYTNGVTLWHPQEEQLDFSHILTSQDIKTILLLANQSDLTPFVNGIIQGKQVPEHVIFHTVPQTTIEKMWLAYCEKKCEWRLQPLHKMNEKVVVTNISMIGTSTKVKSLYHQINDTEELIAYSGPTHEPDEHWWIDIHHRFASKGSAIAQVKAKYEDANIICFGDNDNDASMFAIADECYAPANAIDEIKAMSTQVIGHHNDDGVAQFVRERFNL